MHPRKNRLQYRAVRPGMPEIDENYRRGKGGRPEEAGTAAAGPLAEREGFEPSIPFRVYTLSKRAPSAARPPLRANALNRLAQSRTRPQAVCDVLCDMTRPDRRDSRGRSIAEAGPSMQPGQEPNLLPRRRLTTARGCRLASEPRSPCGATGCSGQRETGAV